MLDFGPMGEVFALKRRLFALASLGHGEIVYWTGTVFGGPQHSAD